MYVYYLPTPPRDTKFYACYGFVVNLLEIFYFILVSTYKLIWEPILLTRRYTSRVAITLTSITIEFLDASNLFIC